MNHHTLALVFDSVIYCFHFLVYNNCDTMKVSLINKNTQLFVESNTLNKGNFHFHFNFNDSRVFYYNLNFDENNIIMGDSQNKKARLLHGQTYILDIVFSGFAGCRDGGGGAGGGGVGLPKFGMFYM